MPVADRAERFAAVPARALGRDRAVSVVAVLGSGPVDRRIVCDVALIDAAAATEYLAAVPLGRPSSPRPRVVVLADAGDGRAADLVRMGAVGWVCRDEPIGVLIETVHAVLRGEVRLPQPLLDELLERPNQPAWKAASEAPVEAVLTRRELEILRLLEQGISRAEIASYLHLSPNTVRSHVQHILNRLGVHSTLAAVARIRTERAQTSIPLSASRVDDRERRRPLDAIK